jgi:hypothetical protein
MKYVFDKKMLMFIDQENQNQLKNNLQLLRNITKKNKPHQLKKNITKKRKKKKKKRKNKQIQSLFYLNSKKFEKIVYALYSR